MPIRSLIITLVFCLSWVSSASAQSLQAMLVDDALHRMEAQDVTGAVQQYKLAVAVHPTGGPLDAFPVAQLPLTLAGDVTVYHIGLLQDALTDSDFADGSEILPALIRRLVEYGAYAAAGGHDDLVEQAALAIEQLFYDFHADPGMNTRQIQSGATLLRALKLGWDDPSRTYSLIWPVAAILRETWPLFAHHILTFPEYWHPLFLDQDEAVTYLPLEARDIPGGYFPADWQAGQPYPDLDGYVRAHPAGLHAQLEPLKTTDPLEAAELYLFVAIGRYEHWLATSDPDAFEKALAHALAVTDLDAGLASGWYLTGLLLSELKDDAAALEMATDALLQTVTLAPDWVEAQLLLGQLLLEQGRFFSAAEQFQHVIEQEGEALVTGAVTTPLAVAYAADGRSRAGILYFQALLEEVDRPCVHFSLAVLQRLAGNWPQAFDHLEQVYTHPLAGESERSYAAILWDAYEEEARTVGYRP